MTTTLGGVTLADPNNPIKVSEEWTGVQAESHDGTVLTDYTNLSRLVFHLEWETITQAQRDVLWTRYQVTGSQTLKPPHTATTYTVVVVRASWEEEPVQMSSASDFRFKVSFQVKEAS